ncbi:MAG: Rabenosyn-5 [Paramarteilia canceri]
MSNEGGQLVGFICPECFLSFASVDKLTKHYDTHNEPIRKNVVVEALLNTFYQGEDTKANLIPLNDPKSIDLAYFETGEVIPRSVMIKSIDYTDIMNEAKVKSISTEAQNIFEVIETLDKFVLNPKSLEADTSFWAPDKLSPICMNCGVKFYMKRHHCRCCGAIICGKCSFFVKHKLAGN